MPEPPVTGNFMFNVLAPSGAVLVDAEVARQDVAFVRVALRNRVWALGLAVLAVSILIAIGPLLERRRRVTTRGAYVGLTAIIALALVGARWIALSAISFVADVQPIDSPLNILVTGLVSLALVALAVTVIERRRIARPRPAYHGPDAVDATGARIRAIVLYAMAGALGALIVGAYEQFLQRVVTRTHLDVLHFSLHPIDVPRFAVDFGLVLMHAAVAWGIASLLHAVRVWWRIPLRHQALPAFAWCAGAALVAVALSRSTTAVPLAPTVLALAMTALCIVALATLPSRARRVSQAARLATLFLAHAPNTPLTIAPELRCSIDMLTSWFDTRRRHDESDDATGLWPVDRRLPRSPNSCGPCPVRPPSALAVGRDGRPLSADVRVSCRRLRASHQPVRAQPS